ncbi:Fur family transcriptional regulator [Acidilobus sp.]|jgi:Fe2+ or Zn2+ uptake regulation protein|uniref:Fur family transcriptional regulator n=1 Tax=Acidilobus sp. TaxID=1872109 RepID=UPI003D07F8D8
MAEDEWVKSKLQEVLEKISSEDKRITPQRVLLTKLILSKVKEHASLKELFDAAQEELPRVGISTVYNTIKMLESMGIVDTFIINDKLRIDQPIPHINVYCLDSDRIFDVDGDVASTVMDSLKAKGLNVKKIVVEAYCSEEKKEDRGLGVDTPDLI